MWLKLSYADANMVRLHDVILKAMNKKEKKTSQIALNAARQLCFQADH